MKNRVVRFQNYAENYAKKDYTKNLYESLNPIDWESEIKKNKKKKKMSKILYLDKNGQKKKEEEIKESIIEKLEIKHLEDELAELRKHQEQVGKSKKY